MRQEGEPSVEEILDSIKKVIARDNRAIAAAQSAPRRREVPVEDMSGTLRNEDKIPGGELPEPVDADEAEEILDLGEAGEIEEDDDSVDGYSFMYANNPRGRVTRVAPTGSQNSLRAKLVKDREADIAEAERGGGSLLARLGAWWRGLFG